MRTTREVDFVTIIAGLSLSIINKIIEYPIQGGSVSAPFTGTAYRVKIF